MSPIVYAIPVFMITILVETWVARRRTREHGDSGIYSLADALTSLHFGIASQVMLAFTWVFTFGFYLFSFEHLRLTTLPRDEWWVWLLALVVYDFCYYWAHRCGHEINLMWASHQVHHSSEYFNLTTALRQTATGAFTAWPFYVAMAVLGVPPIVFATVALIDLLYQYWVHTELVPKLGFVEKILVTPSHHRVHHGQNDYCIDRNYGGVFIIWDKVFGTFAEERDSEKVIYGIRTPLASFNPVWGNLKGYRDIWRQAKASASPRDAIRIWLEPPEAMATQPITSTDLTVTRHSRINKEFEYKNFFRYDPKTRRSTLHYALLQYVLLIAPATHFIAIGLQLPMMTRVGYALLLIAWVVSVGRMLDERIDARRFEVLRITLTAGLFVALPEWFGWLIPEGIKVLVIVFLTISLWTLSRRY
jgi:sterol desaturase/sphingolipid hydroxylase (fatty acid hydroxylase superfamily)